MEFINILDRSIITFIERNIHTSWLDKSFLIITSLGGFMIWFIIAIVFMFFKKYRKYGIVLLITVGVCALLGDVFIKHIVRRIRPCNVYENLNMLVPIPSTYSFPSGHSMKSFASAVIVSKANKKFMIPSFILAFLTAFSRVYLYVHYFTDVFAGSILGIICALFIHKILIENTKVSEFLEKGISLKSSR